MCSKPPADILILGLGTTHDVQDDSIWFPASPYLWRRCNLLSDDRSSRPDIVSHIKCSLDLDLPQSRFDFVLPVYGAHGHMMDDSGKVSSNACVNICNMLKDGGLFACSFPECTRRVFSQGRGTRDESRKSALGAFVADVLRFEPRFQHVSCVTEVKRLFFVAFACQFFQLNERRNVIEKLTEQHKDHLLIFKKCELPKP